MSTRKIDKHFRQNFWIGSKSYSCLCEIHANRYITKSFHTCQIYEGQKNLPISHLMKLSSIPITSYNFRSSSTLTHCCVIYAPQKPPRAFILKLHALMTARVKSFTWSVSRVTLYCLRDQWLSTKADSRRAHEYSHDLYK